MGDRGHVGDRVCVKCGGSWAGAVVFDTTCAHDFDEPPEPVVMPIWRNTERLYYAYDGVVIGDEHPTREGAIALWQAAWRERRREQSEASKRAEHCGVRYDDGTPPLTLVVDERVKDGDTYTVQFTTGTHVHPGALVTRAELREAARSELAATFTVNHSAPVVSAATYAELGASIAKASTEPRTFTKAHVCSCNMHGQEEEEGEWCSDPNCRRKRYQQRLRAGDTVSHQAYLGKPAGEWPAWAIDDFMSCARAKPCGCGSIDWASAAVYGDGSAGQTTYVLTCRQCRKGRAHHA